MLCGWMDAGIRGNGIPAVIQLKVRVESTADWIISSRPEPKSIARHPPINPSIRLSLRAINEA